LETWEVIYFSLFGLVTLYYLLKSVIPHHIYSIDQVCTDKNKYYDGVIRTLEADLGISIKKPQIVFEYKPNDELKGFYDAKSHSITLYLKNLDTVHDFTLTLIEEIHHSIFVNSALGINVYQKYEKIVGYDNNPLEYSAKQFAKEKFRLIHREMSNEGLISYKV
jgi:hypothetical protein